MSDKLMEKYSEEYGEFLGRPWGGQKGGGCFNLLFEFGKRTGYHTCKEDYSLRIRDFVRDLWTGEGWESVVESEEAELFDMSVLEKYDVLVMSFDSSEPHITSSRGRLKHAAIYLGEGVLLHQKANDISRLEYVKSYIPHIRYVLRKV